MIYSRITSWVMVGAAAGLLGGGRWAGAESPFVEVLSANWGKIDQDGNGEISKEEINAALKDHSITGDAAAALAALKVASRGKGELPAMTKSYFAEYAAKNGPVKKESAENALEHTTDPDTAAGQNRGGQTGGQTSPATQPSQLSKGVNWDRNFTAAKARIEKNTAGGQLWNPAVMALETTRQGQLGDCYLVSAMSAVMSRDKERFASLVDARSDGTFTVTYPGRKPVTFEKPTEAELALGGIGASGWLPLMEQAWGRWRSQEKGKGADVEGTDGITGGDSGATLMVLTGHTFHRVSFPVSVEDREAKKGEMLSELRQWLVQNMKERRAITAGTLPRKATMGTPYKTPPGIVKNHVYVIADYDPKTDVVTIWNPHGNTFKPKGADGLENGYTTEHGMFKLPLAEAYSFYTSFTFETNQAVDLKAEAKAETKTDEK